MENIDFSLKVSIYSLITLVTGGLIRLWVAITMNKSEVKEVKIVLNTQIEFINKEVAAIRSEVCNNSKTDRELDKRVDGIAQAVVILETEMKNLK